MKGRRNALGCRRDVPTGAVVLGSALALLALAGAPQDAVAAGSGNHETTVPAPTGKEAVTDREITLAVEHELMVSPQVNSALVDVETEEGVVTLSGTVSNLLAQRYSEKIAEDVKGVRSVVNLITVNTPERSDTALEQDVEDALAYDPATDRNEIHVTVDEGTVTLEGTVESYAEKMLAENVAAGVRGVRRIQNQLTVAYANERSDKEIEQDIRGRLEASVEVDDLLIDIQVQDGRVTLSGVVGSARERNRAFTLAWVAGVRDVKDELEVRWWARDDMKRNDQYSLENEDKVRQSVKDAFLYDPRVYSFQPDVEVQGGVVTLTGTVDNLKARRAAGEDARNTAGVLYVDNHLRVRPEVRLPDDEIRASVAGALARDPYIRRHDLTVVVENAHVYLYGTVDSEFERQHAENVAAGAPGAVDVINELQLLGSTPSDAQLAREVRQDLFWNPYVDTQDVKVKARGGIVTLSGSVDTWFEHSTALRLAREAGADRVIDDLNVEQGRLYPFIN